MSESALRRLVPIGAAGALASVSHGAVHHPRDAYFLTGPFLKPRDLYLGV